jgi:4-alpha-glucanotransferase
MLQGERVLDVLSATGARIIAEDLGVIPDFVRETLKRLEIPGYKVLRWERAWEEEGKPFRNPVDYDRVSVATSGTHDTEPAAIWWDGLSQAERAEIRKLPPLSRLNDQQASSFGDPVHMALLETVYSSRSNLLLLPVQDLFGLRDRINYPGTVGLQNWTWRLPWTLSHLKADPALSRIAGLSAELAQRTGRFGPF